MTVAIYSGPATTEIQPDQDAIWAFVNWWFRGCTRGRMEIGWMDASPAGRGLVHFAKFELSEAAELSRAAAQASAVSGQSVYIRASTVGTADGAFTTDEQFVQAPGIWGDLDTAEQVEHAKTVQSIVRPTASVITGRHPYKRIQTFFRTETPIEDAALVRNLNCRLLALYGGDPAVVNPTRLMRLPGTIAWPWKADRIVELTSFVQPGPSDTRPSSYPVSLLTAQLPHVAVELEPFSGGGAVSSLNTASEFIRRIKAGDNWHDNMVRLVAHWIGRGFSDGEILTLAESFTLPGFSWEQTRSEVGKAIDGGRRKWAKPNYEAKVEGVDDAPGNFASRVYDPWQNLVAPEFPIESLPPVLRNFVVTRAEVIGCDVAALAWSCISAASAALDGQTRLRMKRLDSWTVPPAIWVALVGDSSTKKSPAINAAWHPLERIQSVALDEWRKAHDRWNALPKKSKEETSEPPTPIRLLTHNATIEALQEIISKQDRGLGVLVDELAGLIEGMDRYSGGKASGDRPFYLQAYNGSSYVSDRKSTGTTSARNLLLTICGGIQPDRLARFKDLMDDGFWQRFVPVIVGQPRLGMDAAPGPECDAYGAALEMLARQTGGGSWSFSDTAHPIRERFERELYDLEQTSPLGRRFASFCGKMPGLFGRLCLVLAQFEPGMPFLVSEQVAKSARILTKSALIHAGRVVIGMGGDGDTESVQSVAGYILAKRKERVLASELARDVRACRKQPLATIQRFVSPLVAGGWMNPEKEHAGNTVWTVNPVIHDAFRNRAIEEESRRLAAREQFLMEDED